MKEKDDVLKLLHDLDDEAVEEIAERYPIMDSEEQDALVDMCLKKTSADACGSDEERTGEITVSGTEQYKRPRWYRYVTSAAALVLATVGISGVVAMNHTMNRFKDSNLPGASGDDQSASVSTVIMTDAYSGSKRSDAAATKAVKPVTTTTSATTTVTTSSTTVTETHATTDTTTTEEIVATTTTEVMPTDAVTTAVDDDIPEMTTTVVDARAPIGVWSSGSDSSRKIWHFFSDGNDGRLILDDMGIGINFDYDISGDTIMFHMGGEDDDTPARIEWLTDSSLVIFWKESGVEEMLRAVPESHNSDSD